MNDNGIETQVDSMVKEIEAVKGKDNNDPQPVFDFSNMSYRDNREFGKASADVMQAMISNNSKKLEEAGNRLLAFYAKLIVSMPREWLVPDAPNNLDWSNIESYDYLLATKAPRLREAFNTQFSEAAKN